MFIFRILVFYKMIKYILLLHIHGSLINILIKYFINGFINRNLYIFFLFVDSNLYLDMPAIIRHLGKQFLEF